MRNLRSILKQSHVEQPDAEMPNRILREGILTSSRIAKLVWAEEVFYRRLMSVVDDFGRYYADSGLLHAACYPRQLNKVTDADIGKWLTSCVNAGLVSVYRASDRESYLQLLDFGQQVRAKKSRFPEPLSTCISDAEQTLANAHLDVSVFEDVSVVVSEEEKPARKRADAHPCPEDVDSQVWADWLALRKAKRAPVTETVVSESRRESDKAGIPFEAFLRIWCRRGTQGLEAAWLKPDERGNSATPAQSFRERDLEAKRARVREMSGGLLNDSPSGDMDFIDMEASNGTLTALG